MFKTACGSLLALLTLFIVACGAEVPATSSPTNPTTPEPKAGTPAETMTVTAQPALLHQVNIEPAALTLAVTEEGQIAATALDQSAHPIPGLIYVFRSDEKDWTLSSADRLLGLLSQINRLLLFTTTCVR